MAKTKKWPDDARTQLARLMEAGRQKDAAIERTTKKILNERHYYPRAGSKWKKHPAMLLPYEEQYVWTFLFWAWYSEGSGQVYLLRTEIDGKPFTKAFPSRSVNLEYIPADKATARQLAADAKKHEAAKKKHPELYGGAS